MQQSDIDRYKKIVEEKRSACIKLESQLEMYEKQAEEVVADLKKIGISADKVNDEIENLTKLIDNDMNEIEKLIAEIETL